jgi:DNA-binding response OmpR family regulator
MIHTLERIVCQERAVVATAPNIMPAFTVPTLSLVAPVAEWAADLTEPTILIADDDEGVRELVAYKLAAAGYHAITAEDGTAALDLVHREHPDMVILDVSMPGLDGLSVCYELHSSAATAQIPVLMLSGRDRQVDIDLGLTVGADDYLVKPFSPAELIRRVRWLLLANGD